MTTVITVGGNGRDVLGRALGGYVQGCERIDVSGYVTTTKGYERRVTALDEAIRSVGPCELWAHSQGCEVSGDWLEANGVVAVEKISRIVLLGNPGRKYGGYMGTRWGGRRRRPTPDGPCETLDITHVTDPWGNADQWGVKRRRSALGMTLARHIGIGTDHMDYDDVRIENCKVRAREGNTTWLVAQ